MTRYRFCSVVDGGKHHGVQYYFIDYPPFYDRDALYGTPLGDYHDNPERFALYCRAVLEAAKILGASGCLPLPRLADRADPRPPAHALRRRPRAARNPHRSSPSTTSATRESFPRTRFRS